MPAITNNQHEKFAQALVKGKSHGEAYLAAGYKAKNASVASAAATRLLKKVNIQARVAELQTKAEERAVVDRAWVLKRLVENVDRAMTVIAVTTKDGQTGEYKYEGSVANRALELLGKELGMFVDRKEVGGPGDFERMSDAELDEFIRLEAHGLGIAAKPKSAARH